MLENTVANGEYPEKLIIYGGSGKAARNWEAYHGIVAALRNLADDETLVIQSGKPVAVFGTSSHAPRVLCANTNLVVFLVCQCMPNCPQCIARTS